MKFLNFSSYAILTAVILSGCGGGGGGSKPSTTISSSIKVETSSTASMPASSTHLVSSTSSISSLHTSSSGSSAGVAVIRTMGKSIDSDLIPGRPLQAESSCDNCDPNKTSYEWYVGNETSPVSTQKTFMLNESDKFKTIRLVATPVSPSGIIGKSENIVYQRIQVERFEVPDSKRHITAFKNNGDAIVWGRLDFAVQAEKITSNLKKVVATSTVVAALKMDGTVDIWGRAFEEDLKGKNITNAVDIISTRVAFAVLKADATAEVWGQGLIKTDNKDFTDIDRIVGLNSGAVAAVKKNGDLIILQGGSPSVPVHNVIDIVSNAFSTTVLQANGTAISWGDWAGDTSALDLTNITHIQSNGWAYAAIKKNGDVITWGVLDHGGNYKGEPLKNIVSIWGQYNAGSFVALDSNGNATSWGSKDYGGSAGGKDLTNVEKIYDGGRAYAALKKNGTVVTWGVADEGGDSSTVNLTNVKEIYVGGRAFAAKKYDDSVAIWGDLPDLVSVKAEDLLEVKKVVPVSGGFALIKHNNSVVVVGHKITTTSDMSNIADVVGWNNGFVLQHQDGRIYVIQSLFPVSPSIIEALQPKEVIVSSSLPN